MRNKKNYVVGITVALTFVVVWLCWGLLIEENKGKLLTFDGLDTLFSALTFGGLIFTVWIQLGELRAQEKNTEKSLNALNRITTVLALSTIRQNRGSRITYLKEFEKTKGDFKDEKTPEEALKEVKQIRSSLPKLEARIEELVEDYFARREVPTQPGA